MPLAGARTRSGPNSGVLACRMQRALSGVSVVELGEGIAPAYCAKLFADLGADVVKVEVPGRDEVRGHAGGAVDGASDGRGTGRRGLELHLLTNKRSVALNPAEREGRRLAQTLLEGADLVIESRGRGCLADWGMNWDGLHARRPALSVLHISGFGATGPYANYRWDDIVVQAMGGCLLGQGSPDQVPVRLPANVVLYFIGHGAAVGGLAALLAAESGQEGSFVDCSALELLATMPSRQAFFLGYQYRGCAPPSAELQAAAGTLIPTGVFPCADGYVALMSTTQQLNEMLDVLGDPGAKAAFARPDAFDRPETKEVLDVAVYTWLLARTRAEATAEAQGGGWPLTGVNTAGEVLAADHLHQRNFWTHSDDPDCGPLDLPGPWCRFAEGGWALRRPAPAIGQHTVEVSSGVSGGVSSGVSGGVSSETSSGPPGAEEPGAMAEAGAMKEPAATAKSGATTKGGGIERRATDASAPARPPLEGVRVVDLTAVWAGPYATMLLADLGAEVIRVENPFVLPPTTKGYHPRPILTNPGSLGSLYGPPRPGGPDRPWNRHAMNNSLARNKLSVTIDTRRTEGMELLMRLAEQSDVFIDNFKATGLERIGVDVSELRRRNRRLIIVRLPPAGLNGDWASYTGFGAQFDGLSGLLSVCGHYGSDPTTTPVTTYMDAASGPAGAFAVMAALRYRAATGRGQFVELSQSENVINHLGDMFVDYQLGVEPQRWGNRDPQHAPQGLYPCQEPDRWLAISVPDDSTWRSLAAVVGPMGLESESRFAHAAGRRSHHDEIDGLISAWTESQPMVAAFHALQSAGVPAGPLLDDEMLNDDPQLNERGWFRPLESGDVGTHLHPGLAFSGVAQAWTRGSPTLGEDNEYVYKKLLHVSDEDYRRLEEERILATDYLMADGTPY
jgi:crotonobetainyl-CoA:carnitine CoA-transferase CaiB-like acyl-CoA transferase